MPQGDARGFFFVPLTPPVDAAGPLSLAMPGDRPYVPAMTPAAPMTADELLRLHVPDKHVELVRGVLVVREPAGYRHGEVTARLANLLMNYADAGNLGRVVAAETGFKLTADPDTVRAPDIAFISRVRLPDPKPTGYPELAPDLVVEVLSPSDRPGDVLAKVADWLSAGTRLVWVVDPERRQARVYRQDGSDTVVSANDTLDGEDAVPGFVSPLSAIF